MEGRRRVSSIAVLALLLAAGSAFAENPKVNVDQFRPSVHPGDILPIQTANEPAMLGWGAGAWFSLIGRPLNFYNGGKVAQHVVSGQFVTDLYGHLGLWNVLDIGLDLPFGGAWGAAPGVLTTYGFTKVHGGSLGDLRFSAKGTIIGGNGKGFGLALGEDLSFPTATGHNFMGDKNVTSTTTLIADYSAKGWQGAVNLGFRGRQKVYIGTEKISHQMLIGAGLAAPIICGVLDALGTMEVRVAAASPLSAYDRAMDFSAGLRYHWKGMQLIAAYGGGVLRGYGSPVSRGSLSIAYDPSVERGCVADTDHDGILDPDDECPTEPGPAATNGCPDRDKDGIPDKDDRCVDQPGPRATFGCPDRDKDGIADAVDLCPDKPGPAKYNGCPDTDGDGIPDNSDACPNEPGPAATNGCPDRDHDGVIDSKDKCPDIFGKPEFDGCPPPTPSNVRLTKDKIEILEAVHFDTNKATIKRDSFGLLKNVAKVMDDNPNLARIRVEGHTDNTGDKKKNLKLSQDRARSVMDFLVGAGVAPGRLVSEGFGDTKPIDDNSTTKGKAANRRVEFVIVQQ